MTRRSKTDPVYGRLPRHQRDYRKTGRTTRMLTAALEMVRAGQSVIVYGLNASHARALCYQAKRIAEALYPQEVVDERRDTIRIQENRGPSNDTTLRFLPAGSGGGVDWLAMKPNNPPRGEIVYYDHAAIEGLLASAITEMHRWDQPEV